MVRLSAEEYKKAEKIPVVVVLDNIRSLNNVGSFFRTCDALRIEQIYLSGITAMPPHRDIHKTALGAEDAVPWTYQEEILDVISELKEQGYVLCAVEQVEGSTMLDKLEVKKNRRYAVIFGNEVKGVQQRVVDSCKQCIEIPQEGTKHSLNVAVSAGIVLWELYKQLNKL